MRLVGKSFAVAVGGALESLDDLLLLEDRS